MSEHLLESRERIAKINRRQPHHRSGKKTKRRPIYKHRSNKSKERQFDKNSTGFKRTKQSNPQQQITRAEYRLPNRFTRITDCTK